MKTYKHLFGKLRLRRLRRLGRRPPLLKPLGDALGSNIHKLHPAYLLLVLSHSLGQIHGAAPPAATLIHTMPGGASIHGGVAIIGSSGEAYFSTLSTPGHRANVTALNFSGTQPKWTTPASQDGPSFDMYAVPTLDAAGERLYIGSDIGTFFCLKTSDGTKADGWTDFDIPGTGNRRIRSGAALDPNNPRGSTVYFHCNDGSLYALNAVTGEQRWRAATGNLDGPPTVTGAEIDPDYDQPLSSSPVVSANPPASAGR